MRKIKEPEARKRKEAVEKVAAKFAALGMHAREMNDTPPEEHNEGSFPANFAGGPPNEEPGQ